MKLVEGEPISAPGGQQLGHRLANLEAPRWGVHDDGTPPTTEVDDPVVAERGIRPKNGVHVDAERCRQLARGGEAVAGGDLAGGEATADRLRELVEQRRR